MQNWPKCQKPIIIGFRVKISPSVLQFMRNDLEKRLRIKTFEIIYELIQDVRTRLEKTLEAEIVRTDVGKLEQFWFFGEKKIGKSLEVKLQKGNLKKV